MVWSNGILGGGDCGGEGGGSGGTVNITTDNLFGYGSVRADGGSNYYCGSGGIGSAGGGGRIYFNFNYHDDTIVYHANSGSVVSYGKLGSAGTVYPPSTLLPTLVTDDATDITAHTATGNGQLVSLAITISLTMVLPGQLRRIRIWQA